MKLCIISDTHTYHKRIGIDKFEADVLIHCGDITGNGGIAAITDFLTWFNGLEQFKHKIFIAGNHDWLFQRNNSLARDTVENVGKGNIIYLEDQEVVIDNIRFYGTPVQPPFMNWAFNVFEPKLSEYWKAIPDGIDVLITHGPPYMIGDYVPHSMQHEGSPSLYREVTDRIKPKVHCFGHIHEGYGIKELYGIIFVNASCLNDEYRAVNDPVIIEI